MAKQQTSPLLQELRIAAIVSHPDNPRVFRDKDEDDPALVDLATSIKAVGVLEPVLVRPVTGQDLTGHAMPGFQLCAGERRLRAARLAGLETIPAIVRELTDDQALEVLVTENLQREDLLPLEEARGIRTLLQHGWTLQDVAAKLGRSVGWACQRDRLNTLSARWLEAMTNPKLGVGSWPLGHLLTITTLAPEAQDQLMDQIGGYYLQAGYHMERAQLQRYVSDLVRTLSSAPWKVKDSALYPEAGACSECPERSSLNPGLFEEAKPSKADRCLNPVCWAEKARRFAATKEAELRAKHPGLVLLNGRDTVEAQRDKRAGLPWDYLSVFKGTEGAVPALIVTGKDTGKVEWVNPRPYAGGGPKREVDPITGKPLPKTLPERREDLRRRRIAKAVAAIAEALPSTPAPEGYALLRVVAIFGAEHKADTFGSSYHDPTTGEWGGDPWKALETFSNPERRPTATEMVWTHQVVPVFQGRLTYYSGMDIDKLAREAMEVAALSGLDWEAVLTATTEAIPEPKSWAHLNEDGTPKGREVGGVHETVHETQPAPEEASDDPTETSTAGVCRKCGCTEDDACETEEGEPCHWVEPDLCSACVEEVAP